ncbi:MAG: AAA family ATPase [Solobacterium sp.]|jgi:SpoVK/Ycf46/Vps4 family AAA+-type ATPase|nr:AAA family ATPase [Solobacterium sp.]MCH4205459.1 AAA family ATPase [Solobacterium sp.]MCH4226671.1 AAA family ATPase [Solobacterium sp.]MCH4282146.1 AAA family ATPase [Solobacterium sp.]
MNDDRRRDEKERLMKEVLGTKRAYEKSDSDNIDLEINKDETSTLKQSNDAMDALQQILKKQQKDLADLTKQTAEINPIGVTDQELSEMETNLQKDYGVKTAEKQPDPDTKKIFDDTYAAVSQKIKGENEAVQSLVTAFRRPYVMGTEPGKAKNIILVSGPEGTGRHGSITAIADSLCTHALFTSGEVDTIDMSRYTSGAQEQIFLQDLYEALSGAGSVICFENFETGFPSFLRMLNSLAVEGKFVLSKRYVLAKGILVENQTGLVKDSVDELHAEGKYLIFITSGKPSKVQDAFGADFMYHVLDTVQFKPLDEEAVNAIIEQKKNELMEKSSQQLKITLQIGQDVQDWTHAHFDKTRGAEAIADVYHDFYITLTQAVLEENLGNQETVAVSVINDAPCASVHDKQIRLSREKTSSEELAAINKELAEIVGLDMVKKYISSLQANIAMQQKRREQGMKTASISKHMIFTGNPGTGKTTIARLLARYMKAIGALSEGQLVEVTRADLVAQYVGQTAPLTMSVIKSAMGGVLFIDEAYSLYRGKDDSFGLESIDTLVKAMEDNRDNLIVILAGYKKEMAGFLESNSGLKSRFPNLIDFPDYTGEELTEILEIQAKDKGYTVKADVLPKLQAYFDKVQSINAAEAGNGRLARNLVEEAILKQSERLVQNPSDDMSELISDDFNFTIKVTAPKQTAEPSLNDLANLLKK